VQNEIYNSIKGCTLLDNGTVNYYLSATDWDDVGTQTTWEISPYNLSGFSLHPAFIVDGAEVSHRYYGAYDACVYDGSSYISGTNLNDATSLVDLTVGTGDKLASVKGIYPMVGLKRSEFRVLAANRGSRWRQLDFPLWCAVGMLYVVQSDSPHTIAGAGDSWGNGSTDGSQPSAGDEPGTAYMKYRGIENQFGNCWNWCDAINVNVGGTGNVHIADDNDRANYDDDTSSDHTLVTSSLTTGSDNIEAFLPVDPYFLAESVGGSSAQYITDRHYGSSSSDRVLFVGGGADNGGNAGVFAAYAVYDSGFRLRAIGGRLAY